VKSVKAFLRLSGRVPPGVSLLGAQPHSIFRPDVVDTLRLQPGLSFGHGGRWVSLDGNRYAIEDVDRCLCVGAFVALMVRNENEAPATFEVELRGFATDHPQVSFSGPIGGQLVEPRESPGWREGSELSPEATAELERRMRGGGS